MMEKSGGYVWEMASDFIYQDMAEAEACGSNRTRFGRMLIFSVLVHACCVAMVLSSHEGRHAASRVAFLDLTMEAPAPPPVPPPSPLEKSEAAPLPEVPPQPASTEVEKLRQETAKAVATAATKPESLRQASLSLGITSGYFGSIANGATLNNDIRDYYIAILRTINEKWWIDNSGTGELSRRAIINVIIARDGTIVRAEMAQGSGSYSSDRKLLKALEAASPLPPLPATYKDGFFLAPVIYNPPLDLMSTGSKFLKQS